MGAQDQLVVVAFALDGARIRCIPGSEAFAVAQRRVREIPQA